jgi:hypothetical protein
MSNALSEISKLVYKNSPSGTYEQKVAIVNLDKDIPSGKYKNYGRAEDFNDIANKINEIIDKLKRLPEIPEKTSQLINDSGFISGDTFNSNFSKLSGLLSDTHISGIIQPYINNFQTLLDSYLPLSGGVMQGNGSIGFEAKDDIYDLRHIHPRDLYVTTSSEMEYYTNAGLKLKQDNFQVDLNVAVEDTNGEIQHTVSGPTLSLNSLNNTQSFYVSGALSDNHFGIWRI